MMHSICKSLICSLSVNSAAAKPQLIYFSISVRFYSKRRILARIPVSDYLTGKHNLSPDVALKVSQSIPYIKKPENSDLVLAFLQDIGFSKTHIENVVVKLPKILSVDVENTLKPKLKVLKDLGFTPDDLVKKLSNDPWFLNRTVENRLLPAIDALKNVLGSDGKVAELLKVTRWFLSHNLDKTLVPNIEYIKSCGINMSQMVKFMYTFPRFFVYKHERIKEFVRRADEMGIDRESKLFLQAMRVLCSLNRETWERKFQLFRDLGFSEHDIRHIFQRKPSVFNLSEIKIKKGTEFLLGVGDNDISIIVNNPDILSHSIEGRLKPRVRILEILKSKNVIKKKSKLTTIFKLSEKEFIQKYVIPYSNELGEEYKARTI